MAAKSSPMSSLLSEGRQIRAGLSNIIQTDDSTNQSFIDGKDARQNGWVQTSALVIASIVGTGVLEISGQFGQFGWYVGTVLFILFTPYNYLTGYLLNKIHLQYPTCVTMGDAATAIAGPCFGRVGYYFVYTYLFFVLGNYAVPLSTAIQQIVYNYEMCKWEACCFASVLIFPFIQLRTLGGLALLSAVSFGTIFTVLLITSGFLLGGDTFECSKDELPSASFGSIFNAFGGFFFAYSGQTIFLEMNAEMKEPKEFLKSLNVALPVMVAVYFFVSAVAFSKCENYTPEDYIILGIPKGGVLSVVGVLMLCHMIISYTINSQVLTRGLLVNFGVYAGLEEGIKGRAIWCAATTTILIIAQVLANLIPNFGTFCSFISAFLITPICFIIPCTLYLIMDSKRSAEHKSGIPLKVAIVAVLTSAIFYWILGTGFAVAKIVSSSAALQCNSYHTAGGHKVINR